MVYASHFPDVSSAEFPAWRIQLYAPHANIETQKKRRDLQIQVHVSGRFGGDDSRVVSK